MTRQGIQVRRGQERGSASGGAKEVRSTALLHRLGRSEVDCLPADRIGYFHPATSYFLNNHAFASDALAHLQNLVETAGASAGRSASAPTNPRRARTFPSRAGIAV